MGLDIYLYQTIFLSEFQDKAMRDKIKSYYPDIPQNDPIRQSIRINFEVGSWHKDWKVIDILKELIETEVEACMEHDISYDDLVILAKKYSCKHTKAMVDSLSPGGRYMFSASW